MPCWQAAAVPLSQITHVNGAPVTDKKSVVRAVSAAAPGSAITLMFQPPPEFVAGDSRRSKWPLPTRPR